MSSADAWVAATALLLSTPLGDEPRGRLLPPQRFAPGFRDVRITSESQACPSNAWSPAAHAAMPGINATVSRRLIATYPVDHPRNAKLVHQHPESLGPKRFLHRHSHLPTCRQGVENMFRFHRIRNLDGNQKSLRLAEMVGWDTIPPRSPPESRTAPLPTPPLPATPHPVLHATNPARTQRIAETAAAAA